MAHSRQYTITCDRCDTSKHGSRRDAVARAWREEGGTYTAGRGSATCHTCRNPRQMVVVVTGEAHQYVACVDSRGREVGVPVPLIDDLPVKELVEVDRWPGNYPRVRLADGRTVTIVDPTIGLEVV